jgi:hypothetical protein
MAEGKTNPNTEACTVVTFQSTNFSNVQCVLVPDLSIYSDFNFVSIQRIGIVLIEPDSTVRKWTMGVEEKGAIGERKLESGVGGVLWSIRTPVGTMRFVGMTRLMGVTGLMGMTRFMRMIRLVWMVWLVRRIGLVGMFRIMGRLWFLGIVGFAVAVVMPLLATMPNLLGLGPLSVLITFQALVGIESSLCRLSVFQVSGTEGRLYQ